MTAAVTTGRRVDRVLPVEPVELSVHTATHGALPYPDVLLREITEGGLTGRGGAGFPVGRKLAAVLAASGHPVVVGNAAEGEPASAKDRQLLYHNPHLVLDGLQLVTGATGATETYLYVMPDPDLHRRLGALIAERERAGVDRHRVRLVRAEAGFLAGQETAAVRAVAGGPGLPTYAPVRISTRGLHGRPTLVHNVETLAHMALIGRYGAAWFRSAGTATEPGTMLSTVWPARAPAFVAEYELGTPLGGILGTPEGCAVLVGGYHGSWLPSALVPRLTLSNAELRPLGAALGAGVLAELPAWCCGVRETARIMTYLAAESAGQCGPCLNGLPRMAGAMTALAEGVAGRAVLPDLRRWDALVSGRGACGHPDGSMRLLRSALSTFAAEIGIHLGGGCSARATAGFLPVPPGRLR